MAVILGNSSLEYSLTGSFSSATLTAQTQITNWALSARPRLVIIFSPVSKYTRQKGSRLYSCFVDYRKAFDTVCREALLFKLSKLGMKGNFYNCISHMYQNSSAKLKMVNKISEAIDILAWTEQGHLMSPKLFMAYLLDLSEDLNDITEDPNVM